MEKLRRIGRIDGRIDGKMEELMQNLLATKKFKMDIKPKLHVT